MSTEIRQISFSNLRRCGRKELKFVYEELGHLWLTFHGKPRAVIIPMRDEEILHSALGLNICEALHRAQIDHTRRIAALDARAKWESEHVITQPRSYPGVGQTDADRAEPPASYEPAVVEQWLAERKRHRRGG